MDEIDSFLDSKDDELDAFLDSPESVKPIEAGIGSGIAETLFGVAAPMVRGLAPSDESVKRGIEFVSEEGTPVAGAMMGAAAVAPFAPAAGPLAPLVIGAGGAMGAMGARGLQRTYQYGAGLKPIPSTGEAISDIKSAGEAGVINELGGQALSATGKAIAPTTKTIGQQIIRGMTGIRESVSGPVLNNLKSLFGGVDDAAKGAYEAFERYTGLKGIGAQEVETGVLPSANQMIQQVYDTGRKLASNQPVDPQELYTASQMASRLKQMARFQNAPPELASRVAAIEQGKGMIDDALGKVFPEYKSLRSDYASQKAREQFSSVFPLQRNLSPDAMRMMLPMLAGAGTAAATGDVRPLLLPLAFSPLAYKTALQGAYLGAQALTSPVGQAAARTGVQTITDEYNKRRYRVAP